MERELRGKEGLGYHFPSLCARPYRSIHRQHVFANIELIRGRCRCSVVDVQMEEHLQAASARLHGMMD